MLSRWTSKTLSPAAKNSLTSIKETPTEDCKEDGESLIIINKLKQENQQLRRELNDAYHRIRSLEENLAVLVVSSTDDDDDNESVEVQSVMSTDHMSLSSSASTVATGSAKANKARARQQKRDDILALKNHHKANRASLRDRHRIKKVSPTSSPQRGDPVGVLMQSKSSSSLLEKSPTRVSNWAGDPTVDRLMWSSVSECDESSECTVASSGAVGRLLVTPPPNRKKVAPYTSVYFTRTDSDEENEIDEIDTLVYSLVEI